MTLNYCVISNYSLKMLSAKACFNKRKTLSHLKLRIKKLINYFMLTIHIV